MALVGVTTLEWNIQKFNNIVIFPYQMHVVFLKNTLQTSFYGHTYDTVESVTPRTLTPPSL